MGLDLKDRAADAKDRAGGALGAVRQWRWPDGRLPVIISVGLFVALAGVYATGYALTSDRIPRDVSVAGVDIGGLSQTAASDKLQAELVPRASEPVFATHDGERYRISPRKAGLSLDVQATIDSAGGGRSFNPLRMIEVLSGGEDIEPVLDVDKPALQDAVERVAKKVDRQPKSGTVRFATSEAKPVYPKPGARLDQAATAAAVTSSFLDVDPKVELPVSQTPSELTKKDIDAAMAEFAEPAMSGPLTLQVPGREVKITPRRFSSALTMEPQDGELVPRLDEQKLSQHTANAFDRLTRDPRPAKVVLRGGSPEVVSGRKGTEVDRSQFASQVLPALSKTSPSGRTITLKASTAQPEFSTADARGLRIDEVVSDFTTYFPHSSYRNNNLGRAAELISGTVLKPGDTFSLNDTVGERTAANGFEKGYIIDDGVLVEDYGGGVSQVATTTYNAAFFAGLKDVEHHPHSLYFDRYPMGREATVLWGSLDLQFQNNTPYGVLVQAWIEPSTPSSYGEMHVQIWSTDYWDVEAELSDQYAFSDPDVRYDTSKDCVEQTGIRGFQVDSYRHLYRNGERVKTEKTHVIYDAGDAVRCHAKPEQTSNSSGGSQG
ncbi:MAG: VanW family protein [Nocardioidaceae bacterium]